MGTDRSLWWKSSLNGGANWTNYVSVGAASNGGISVTKSGASPFGAWTQVQGRMVLAPGL
jgi:hypothetical protein